MKTSQILELRSSVTLPWYFRFENRERGIIWKPQLCDETFIMYVGDKRVEWEPKSENYNKLKNENWTYDSGDLKIYLQKQIQQLEWEKQQIEKWIQVIEEEENETCY